MKQIAPILIILITLNSCYKEEYTYVDSNFNQPDSASFMVIGAGFNGLITTNYVNQTKYYDPNININGSLIHIGITSPMIEIYLTDHDTGTYLINGNTNRAYLKTTDFIGDAISGTIQIINRIGTVYYSGSFDLTFRNNALNPTDTIQVNGVYKIDDR